MTATMRLTRDGPHVRLSQSDPKQLDVDADGLPDVDEADYGTDPNNPDTDSDGFKWCRGRCRYGPD